MSKQFYTEDELKQYFDDPAARRGRGHPRRTASSRRPERGFRGYLHRRFKDPRKAQAAFALSLITGFLCVCLLALGAYTLTLTDDLPPFSALDNPDLQLATVAYTADGKELARYAFQNRSWVTFDEISPHVTNALVATEDHRFHEHWGIDLFRTISAVAQTLLGDRQGGSTITQQLARNLYNQEIGFEVSVTRKLKEMITAAELERRYTKREIIEMYLNTVPFNENAFGIEAAARTFFSTPAAELDPLQAASLVGMLKATTYYNPYRNPDNAKRRRNVVLSLMVKHGFLDPAFYQAHKDDPVETYYSPSEITDSLAPYFADHVRLWMRQWAKENGYDFYQDGLVVYTTLDSRYQELARKALEEQTDDLQRVVDYEWSRASGYYRGGDPDAYPETKDEEKFRHFWNSKRETVNAFIRETERFKRLRSSGVSEKEALTALHRNTAFIDSLKEEKTRLEAGFVALDPRTGHVKAWVGGRNLKVDWYDHVAKAARQPGSTFKPFVYTAAIDNGYSPWYTLPDSTLTYRDPSTGQIWSPSNFGGSSGQMLTLREGLATSNNLISARIITQLVNPSQVAFYARRMGIKSELDPVPALALGTSDVTLLEMASAYSTLANGGLHHEPTVVTRIEDRYGNVLYEALPTPQEALSEETAYTVVDMMRGVINHERGTGVRIRYQYGLGDYDLAAKTGTTQNSADGWFIMMHPELVTGAWVGFNDRRVAFRSNFWGQGAHNALFIVGDFFKRAVNAPDIQINKETRFPMPEDFGLYEDEADLEGTQEVPAQQNKPSIGW